MNSFFKLGEISKNSLASQGRGIIAGGGAGKPRQQENFLDLARSFIALPSRRHQEAICDLARAMADPVLPDSA